MKNGIKQLKIYKMNECHYWADYSLKEAKINYLKFMHVDKRAVFSKTKPPRKLTPREMQSSIFAIDPGAGKYLPRGAGHNDWTQQDILDLSVKDGFTKPFFFASVNKSHWI